VTTRNDAGYRRSLEVHDKLEALYPRIEQHAARFRGMAPADSRLPRPPGKTPGLRLDPMVCALAIKAATTKRAVFTLCELGDGDKRPRRVSRRSTGYLSCNSSSTPTAFRGLWRSRNWTEPSSDRRGGLGGLGLDSSSSKSSQDREGGD
jgi:hypothetical protein